MLKHFGKLRLVGTQMFVNGTTTKINFDSCEFDQGGISNLPTSMFVIQHNGFYRISGYFGFDTPFNDVGVELWVQLRINRVARRWVMNASGNLKKGCTVVFTETFQLTMNDIVELYGFQASGSNLNIPDDLQYAPFLEIEELE